MSPEQLNCKMRLRILVPVPVFIDESRNQSSAAIRHLAGF